MRRIYTILLSLLAVTSFLPAQTRTETAEAPALRVTGTGTSSTNPDHAYMYIAVVTRDTSAQNAGTENARILTAVIAAIRPLLGAGSSLTTVNYSLDPNYVYPRDGGEPTLRGYVATNTMKVETSDLSRIGPIVDAAIDAGANNVNGITYTIRDQTKLRGDALAAAAQQARAKAEALATASGVRLGGIRLIEESMQFMPGPVMRSMREGGDVATPILSGPVEMQASVTITYDIAR